MDRTLHMLGGDGRACAACLRLRELGRRVVCRQVVGMADEFAQDSLTEPCVWLLPYPFSGRARALIDELPRGVGGYVVTGGLSEEDCARLAAAGFCHYDLNRDEQFLRANAHTTAEGAIELALAMLPCTLKGTECLVVGFGRIGKALTGLLQGFGAKVTVSARRREDLLVVEHLGLRSDTTGVWRHSLGRYRCIFQTVPHPVFTAETVCHLRPDCLFLDLASAPYGADEEAIRLLGERYLRASGLPGKTAPQTAGRDWADAIYRALEEKGL